ncbi:Chloroplast import component protein (Tic20) [compost metagenome]
MLTWIPFFGWFIAVSVIPLVGLVLWIILMVKAYQGELFKLPMIGEIAEKNI